MSSAEDESSTPLDLSGLSLAPLPLTRYSVSAKSSSVKAPALTRPYRLTRHKCDCKNVKPCFCQIAFDSFMAARWAFEQVIEDGKEETRVLKAEQAQKRGKEKQGAEYAAVPASFLPQEGGKGQEFVPSGDAVSFPGFGTITVSQDAVMELLRLNSGNRKAEGSGNGVGNASSSGGHGELNPDWSGSEFAMQIADVIARKLEEQGLTRFFKDYDYDSDSLGLLKGPDIASLRVDHDELPPKPPSQPVPPSLPPPPGQPPNLTIVDPSSFSSHEELLPYLAFIGERLAWRTMQKMSAYRVSHFWQHREAMRDARKGTGWRAAKKRVYDTDYTAHNEAEDDFFAAPPPPPKQPHEIKGNSFGHQMARMCVRTPEEQARHLAELQELATPWADAFEADVGLHNVGERRKLGTIELEAWPGAPMAAMREAYREEIESSRKSAKEQTVEEWCFGRSRHRC